MAYLLTEIINLEVLLIGHNMAKMLTGICKLRGSCTFEMDITLAIPWQRKLALRYA